MDSSAFVKFIAREPESPALRQWCRKKEMVSSALLNIEVQRAIAQRSPQLAMTAKMALLTVHLVPIDKDVIADGAVLPPGELRTLDAIHMATARKVRRDIGALVAYDDRLLTAARLHGFKTVSPT